MDIPFLILTATAILTALMAGLFYAWSISVMRGFARLKDREFVAAMQATNRAIQNPLFFIAFFGAPVLLPVSTYIYYGNSPQFELLFAASLIYIIGNLGVTMFGNVPLNNALERFNLDEATDSDISQARTSFERRWNNLNTIRTVSSILALILVVIACSS